MFFRARKHGKTLFRAALGLRTGVAKCPPYFYQKVRYFFERLLPEPGIEPGTLSYKAKLLTTTLSELD